MKTLPFDFWDKQADDLAKYQGWLLSNDSSGRVTIARMDEPQAWRDADVKLGFTRQPFKDDMAAGKFVVELAANANRHALLAIWLQGYDVEESMDMPPPKQLLFHTRKKGKKTNAR